ncbi:hypothetical protein C8D99_1203 [Aminivibrio pyruvatiphilus]|uniref:Uncharacterized protein n=1 Tax=Aminivibrio pyruvatiphilus TaxID=1005740 RepID=A0A4R8M2S3_9BACT|nr:hypothetical protein [Aminivibrio pyruvatiphilus]TDY55922.1 hypothetical protein C8D99_1203 [Aminivibrio pyruvatiphilus]
MSMIDYSWRPEGYFEPTDPEDLMLSRITGAARREAVRKMVRDGGMDAVPEGFGNEELSERHRTAWGRIHPMCMGGEFLLPCEPGELEIARLTIRSTTYDVLSVRAKRTKNRIRVRVDDEYDGETLNRKHMCTSVRPLTLGRLLDLVITGWDFFECLENNYPDDLEGQLGFFWGESRLYPEFDEALRERVTEYFRAHHEAEEDEENAEGEE